MIDRHFDICPNCGSDCSSTSAWILMDNMGFGCGYVCDSCESTVRAKYDPSIFAEDSEEYRDRMAHSGESFEADYQSTLDNV